MRSSKGKPSMDDIDRMLDDNYIPLTAKKFKP
jgi:hypothetical protein